MEKYNFLKKIDVKYFAGWIFIRANRKEKLFYCYFKLLKYLLF